MRPIINNLIESFRDAEIRKVIRCADVIMQIEQEQPAGRIDKDVINELKVYYEGLDLEQLLLLWHDAYNSMMSMKGISGDNLCSYLVRNKCIALGSIINQNH